MKRSFRGIQLLVFLSILFAFFIVFDRFSSHIFSFDTYSCTIDPICSEHYKNKLVAFLYKNKDIKDFSLDHITQKIKDSFPLINSVIARHSASGILHLTLLIKLPLFIINKNFVLTRDGLIFISSLFSKDSLAKCVNITFENYNEKHICETPLLTESFKKMLNSLPKNAFKHYHVKWENDIKSYLYDKSNEDFAILYNINAIPTEKIINACQTIKSQLEKSGKFSLGRYANNKCPKKWIADTRFKGQIVLFCENQRGG